MMDKNSISEIDEKQENGAGSGVGDNWPDTTVEKNTMTSESQNFRLVDFEQSQSTQIKSIDQHKSNLQLSSNIVELKKKDNNDDDHNYNDDDNNKDKSDEMQNIASKVDEDGGEVIENENKVTIESEKSVNDLSISDKSVDDDDNDIVRGTPPDQLFSPGKRQLLGTTSAHKRKISDSDEPASKISRSMDDNIIPETQESLPDVNELLNDSINDNVKQCLQSDNEKEISDTNENTVENVNNKDPMTIDVVNQESLHVLSQALENVHGNEEKMEIDENNVTVKEQSKKTPLESGIVNKTDIDKKPIEETIINLPMKSEKTDNPNDDNVKSASAGDGTKSRMSIEVIYDKSLASSSKPKELVEIDEDGEKIVLDSSHEDQTLNDSDIAVEKKQIVSNHPIGGDIREITENTEIKMTNGNKDCPKSTLHSDRTATVFTDSDMSIDSHTGLPRIPKVPEILSAISDSEEDSFMNEEKNKIKTIPIEKEIAVLIKVKCVLHVDEVSKEIISKEISSALCENGVDLVSSRRRTSSALGLADISDAKDSVSPSSVTSNPRFPLNPRYSTISQASTSSSSSSGSFKLPLKDGVLFSLPRGVPKHAKKAPEPLTSDDSLVEKLKKEWKNTNLMTTSLLNFLNSEIITIDLHNGTSETSSNSTSEHFRSSTPETPKDIPSTPKSTEKVRLTKRTRSQNLRNSSSNGLMKQMEQSPITAKKIPETVVEKLESDSTNESLISAASTPSRQSVRSLSILRNQTPVYDPSDALIGKQCFAKWGDNNYYPGIVSSRSKTKFKVTFLDGLSKLLIKDFIVAIPSKLPVGLSIYASVKEDEYGSCGMIRKVDDTSDPILYIVETDEGEKINVPLSEIFLTTDQVIILKELMNNDMKTPPSTPTRSDVSLDNVVDGNRRNISPAISTPKSTREKCKENTLKKVTDARPSGSGVPSKINFDSDTDFKTSDSGGDDEGLGAIQVEIVGTTSEFTAKGPQNRVKGKARSKKKVDDQETITLLGPIPEEGSTLFKGMNFILTCASLESLDKYKMDNKTDSNSESGTDLEQDWNSTPFVRERLTAQITAGGGKVYEKFEDIPKTEYGITKLITNVPNITAKSLQCLSVGIQSLNHKWVIRSCLDNKLVNLNQEKLPAGWSFDRRAYIEMCDRPTDKPFSHIIIAVPKIAGAEESTKFWKQIIENAGGIVRLIDDPSDNFVEATAVLTNRQCPNWIEQRARIENIPLVSTTWIIQCLFAGVIISHETQDAYFHRYMK